MPHGTLTLHTQRRDITVELVHHSTAARIIRTHTGRISAAEAFFRGDELDDADFDGKSKLLSIGLSRVLSIEWDPYPEGDGDLPAVGGETKPLTEEELRRLLRALWRAKDEAASASAVEPADTEADAEPAGTASAPAEPLAAQGATKPPRRQRASVQRAQQ